MTHLVPEITDLPDESTPAEIMRFSCICNHIKIAWKLVLVHDEYLTEYLAGLYNQLRQGITLTPEEKDSLIWFLDQDEVIHYIEQVSIKSTVPALKDAGKIKRALLECINS